MEVDKVLILRRRTRAQVLVPAMHPEKECSLDFQQRELRERSNQLIFSL